MYIPKLIVKSVILKKIDLLRPKKNLKSKTLLASFGPFPGKLVTSGMQHETYVLIPVRPFISKPRIEIFCPGACKRLTYLLTFSRNGPKYSSKILVRGRCPDKFCPNSLGFQIQLTLFLLVISLII